MEAILQEQGTPLAAAALAVMDAAWNEAKRNEGKT
jgi:hypothetical protein